MKRLRAIVTSDYYANYGDGEILVASDGDEVEILKEVNDAGWLGGGFYVIYNEKTEESMVLAKGLVEKVVI